MTRLLLAAAFFLMVIRLVVPHIRVSGQLTLGQAHVVCSSWVGVLAQAYSGQVSAGCGRVALAYDGLNVVTLAAVLCLLAGALLAVARRASHA
jgi:hypothetical protein